MIKTDTIHIGRKLKQAMDESRFTRKEISRKTGIPDITLYKLVKSPDIKVSTLMKLAGFLEVPLQFFFNVENSELVTELNEALLEERSRVIYLEQALENIAQQFELLLQIIKELEKQAPDNSEKKVFTQLLPGETTPITLSSFLYTYQKMIKAADPSLQKEEMFLKYAERFLNILEIRQIIKENPLFIPGNIRDVFTEELDNKAVDEYIDIRKLWKSI